MEQDAVNVTRRYQSTGIPTGLSSLSEPGVNLFPTVTPVAGDINDDTPLPDSPRWDDDDQHRELRADIRAMGHMLGQVIKRYQGQDIFDKVETMRSLAKVRANSEIFIVTCFWFYFHFAFFILF